MNKNDIDYIYCFGENEYNVSTWHYFIFIEVFYII